MTLYFSETQTDTKMVKLGINSWTQSSFPPINSSCSYLENFVLYFLAHQISVNSEPVKTIECSFRECFQLSESISAWRWTLMSAILTSWHLHLYYLPCFSTETYSQENQENIMFFTCGSNVNVLLGLKVWRKLKKDRFVKLSILLLKIFHPQTTNMNLMLEVVNSEDGQSCKKIFLWEPQMWKELHQLKSSSETLLKDSFDLQGRNDLNLI